MGDLHNKTILITGATGALGSETVRQCAAAGARLALTARSADALAALAKSLATPAEQVWLHPADLTSSASVSELMSALVARWGGTDILLHTAGGWAGGARLAEVSDAEWQAQLELNLLAAFHINRAVLPWMLEHKWGRIVNIAARAAALPGAKQSPYNVAKAGLVALTASIAQDYRRSGVTANCLLPGTIDTAENRRNMPDGDFTRWVKPTEIVSAMLYLASDAAAAVNGAALPVYGQS
ncbi:MAG: SDR family NAD(P)-dependent oxidoreductase [Chloroflexi bacterium]|nr:SDR family NAD(P)-dependent oxidoreductase [Chloroflexota bacterium]